MRSCLNRLGPLDGKDLVRVAVLCESMTVSTQWDRDREGERYHNNSTGSSWLFCPSDCVSLSLCGWWLRNKWLRQKPGLVETKLANAPRLMRCIPPVDWRLDYWYWVLRRERVRVKMGERSCERGLKREREWKVKKKNMKWEKRREAETKGLRAGYWPGRRVWDVGMGLWVIIGLYIYYLIKIVR